MSLLSLKLSTCARQRLYRGVYSTSNYLYQACLQYGAPSSLIPCNSSIVERSWFSFSHALTDPWYGLMLTMLRAARNLAERFVHHGWRQSLHNVFNNAVECHSHAQTLKFVCCASCPGPAADLASFKPIPFADRSGCDGVVELKCGDINVFSACSACNMCVRSDVSS